MPRQRLLSSRPLQRLFRHHDGDHGHRDVHDGDAASAYYHHLHPRQMTGFHCHHWTHGPLPPHWRHWRFLGLPSYHQTSHGRDYHLTDYDHVRHDGGGGVICHHRHQALL